MATEPLSDVVVGAGNIARCDRTYDEATAAILDTIPGTVFTAGDNTYSSGSASEFATCYGASWGRHAYRTRPAVGDREYKVTGATGYFGYFGAAAGDPARGYYSYDLTGWHVIVLNTGSSRISTKAGSAQELWLRADLAANSRPCILAYWHHPRFSSSGTAVRSSIKALWDDLYAAHADIVVNAHYRVYERFALQTPGEVADPQNGIREFIVGTGGQGSDAFSATVRPNSEVRSSGTYGVLKLTLGPGTYEWRFIPRAGQTFTDAGTGTCHGAVPVASVMVSPETATLPVGAMTQLTAQPLDGSGNPLNGRLVTWQSRDPGIATVSTTGLVTGVAVGMTTVIATSDGQDGSSAITIVAPPPPDAPCLERQGPIILLGGVRTSAYSNTALSDYTRVDGSTAQFLTDAGHPVVLGGGRGGCFRGGEILGQWPPSSAWEAVKEVYAVRVRGIPDFELENARAFDYGDGASLEGTTSHWTIRHVHFKFIRDDCVQNDGLNSGVIDSSFFEGCYVGVSARSSDTTRIASDNLVVLKNSLFSLQDMDQGYAGPGHGAFFKWSTNGPKVSVLNNVFRVDGKSSLGKQTFGPPQGKLAECANNVMIWLGAGPFPETLPACYTLLTGAAGLEYWNAAVAAWQAAHANSLDDVAAPIVSLYSPQAGGTLSGTVHLIATAVDDRAVVGVQFQLNGENLGPEITTESPATKYTSSWDTRGVPDGTYTLGAIARDAAGHSATSAATVAINNLVSASQSSVTVAPESFTAGMGSSVITVTTRDPNGAPLSGVTVSLSASGRDNVIVQPSVPTDAAGTATGSLSSTATGVKAVTATADGVLLTQQASVTVTAGPVDPIQSGIRAVPESITAGSAPATITVTLRDQFGNPVSGSEVVLDATGSGNTITQPAGRTNAQGEATGWLGSTKVETKSVSARADGNAIAQTVTVTVLPAPTGAITHTLLTFGNNVINQKVYTTSAIAPAPDALVTVAVLGHNSTSAPPSPVVSGGGLSGWTVVATTTFDALSTPHKRLTIYRAMGAAPGSGPITITWSANVSNCQWIVSQWAGVETGGVNGADAIVQAATMRGDTVAGLSVPLMPLETAENATYGIFGTNAGSLTITAGAGFTEIAQVSSTESPRAVLQTEWGIGRTLVDATSSALLNAAVLALEIRALAPQHQTVVPVVQAATAELR